MKPGLLPSAASLVLLSAGVVAGDTSLQPWKPRHPGSLEKVSWAGDRWVAVSSEKGIYTSTDGVSWQSAFHTASGVGAVARLGDTLIAPASASRTLLSRNVGANWFLRENPSGAAVSKVAGNGSRVVGCNSFGTKVATTTDGFTWTTAVNVTGLGTAALVWTGDRFVTVGQSNISVSPDGTAWSAAAWSGRWLNDVTGHAGGPLVAVGLQGQVGKSTDGGATWTALDSTPGETWEDVAGVSGSYVAINEHHDLFHSADGVTWAEVGPAAPTSLDYHDVGWNGSHFLAVGDGGAVAKSADGLLWEDHSIGTEQMLTDIAAGPPGLVAVGQDSIVFSADGFAWQRVAAGDGVDWQGVAWCGDRFVAVGGEGRIGNSTDGLNWSIADRAGGEGLSRVAWSGSRAVATGPIGAVYTSENRVDWTRRTSGIPAFWSGRPVTWTGTRFVAFASAGSSDDRVIRSDDGLGWTATADPLFDADAIASGGGRIVAVNSTFRAVSDDDGETWSVSEPFSPFAFGKEILWDGSRFVAAAGTAFWSSPDGAAWTNANQNTSYGIEGLAVTPSGYVGVAVFGSIWTSGPDDRPVASLAPVTAGEAAGPATLTVALSHATGQDLAIDYATGSGTATPGADYQAVSGTLVVPAGQTQASFTVPVLDDAVHEVSQTFPIEISSLSGGEGAFFESPAPKVTISNDDLARIYVDDLTVNESSGTAAVKIRCPDPREPSVSVSAMTQNGTGIAAAMSPGDFIQRSTTLVMPPDQNELSFEVTIVDDYVPERQETFLVGASGSGLAIADSSATITLVDGGPGYDGWAQQQGYNPNQHSRFVATGDHDKDGNPNLVSFAMGLPIGQPVSVAAAGWLTFLHPPAGAGDRMMLATSVPDPLPAGLRWEAQESTDGQIWTSVATATPAAPWSGAPEIPVTVGEPVAGRRLVTIGSSFTRAASPVGMMRMKWTLLPPP